MALLDIAQNHISGLKKKTAKEWAGPCPECGGTDRFIVWPDKEAWYCRGCDQGGDVIAFLRRFAGMSCPEAHEAAGMSCDSAASCPAAAKCRLGDRAAAVSRPDPAMTTPAAKVAAEGIFAPAAARPPAELWRDSAAKLIERANADLLACPEQLAYLAGRGLPRGAVERFRLGWIGEDLYRSRQTWGLPEEISDKTGKPKKLWLPAGIVIPFFGADGHPFRIRIRRHRVEEGRPRYYWLPGSGDDVPVINAGAKAFVVVESDLDGYLVAWSAGDIAGAVPLGTCNAKPKDGAMQALENALAILVALDFEPRRNAKTGRNENPGGQAASWWLQHFPRAVRWPVPAGKDPGEYVQDHGGDIRAWVLAGLPPVFQVQAAKNTAIMASAEAAVAATATQDCGSRPLCVRGVSWGGIPYIVADTPQLLERAKNLHPDHVPFLRSEINRLQGFTKEQAHHVLLAKQALPEGEVISSHPLPKRKENQRRKQG